MNDFTKENLPLGFGMTLAQNIDAMKRFSGMTADEQQTILNKAKSVKSKREMAELVSSLAE